MKIKEKFINLISFKNINMILIKKIQYIFKRDKFINSNV
jgi:hypothetical protein